MSLFYQILDEHKELLESRGFTEEALSSPDKPGWFMRQLHLQFSKCSHDAHLFNEIQEFDLKAIGFFDNDADIVLFKFHYQFNPESAELNIKGLEASLDREQKLFRFTQNTDLPQASDIYKSFSNLVKLNRAKEIANCDSTGKRKRL